MTHTTLNSIGAEIQYGVNEEPYFSSLGSDPFLLFHQLSGLWLLCFKARYLHLVDNFKWLHLFVQWINFSFVLWLVLHFCFYFGVFFLIWFLFPMVMELDSMIPSWGNWTYVAFNFFWRKEQLN